jgi:integrase
MTGQTGQIEWRGVDRCRLTVQCGVKDGKQIRKRRSVHVTGRTDAERRKEAERALAEFTTEIERGLVIDGKKISFKEFADRWLKDYAEPSLAPKTLFRYKEILDTRILPSLGHIKLDQLRPTHIIEFENMLREDGIRKDKKTGGLSEKTILQHHRIISSILSDAVQWQLLFSNPAARVKPPKVPKKQAKCYDEEQVATLLDALDQLPPGDLKYRVMVELALTTGLRRGELGGLEWKDLDFDKCTLDVRQASQYIPGQGCFIKDPKNETSKRLIAVPASTIALLKKWKAQQAEKRLKVGDLWIGDDWVFTTWNGKRINPDRFTQWFPEFLEKNNLPHIPLHSMRHTSATLLIAEGVDLREVSGRLGHADTSTTGNIYAHFLKSADRAAADKMENLITRNRNKKQDSRTSSSK